MIILVNVIMLNVIMLNVIILNVIMLNVIMPKVVVLNVVRQKYDIADSIFCFKNVNIMLKLIHIFIV